MEFRFSAEEEAFRQEVLTFLKKNPPESFPIEQREDGFGYGAWSTAFAKKMGENGWVSLTWPKELGGRGAPMMHELIMLEELAYHRAPTQALLMSMPLGQMIVEMGNDFLKKTILPQIAKGDFYAWMALSEPQAGSDLLSLDTRAVEDGDYYVLNGQKVWSSIAHLADWAYIVVRTDPNVPRHKGLSMFIMDKSLPGISIRPIISMAGLHIHNEVFMDNVRIPKEYLLGVKNNGFFQMLKTLEVDRFWARFIKAPHCRRILENLIQYCKESKRDGQPLAKDPVVRHKLAQCAVEIEANRMLFYHAGWVMNQGQPLTYEATMGKIMADEMGQRLYNVGMQILGPIGVLDEDSKWAHMKSDIQKLYLLGPGHTIAGGTNEIMRTTLATIGLKLPRS